MMVNTILLWKILKEQKVHEGKADHISGLKKLDNYTMEVTFDKKNLTILQDLLADRY